MNILNLLIKERHVAGIEIDDTYIRIAYFRPKKGHGKIDEGTMQAQENELVLLEEALLPGIVSSGVVIDKDSLSKILKNLWIKAGLRAYYAIVAISPNKIYSRTFIFPRTIDSIRLTEAVNLAIDFQFPVKKNDSYIDWENVGNPNTHNEILISAAPKNIVNDYTSSLDQADIKVLALESHLASIGRLAALESNQPTLITKNDLNETTVCILKNGLPYFSRTIPTTFMKKSGSLSKEIEHIKTSFESEKGISIVEIPLTNILIKDEYARQPELKKLTIEQQSKWLVSIGAAIRGEILKGKDNHISLLSIGTAETYTYQKTAAFIALIRNIILGVSLFFLCTFITSYVFIFSLPQTTRSTYLNISPSLVSAEILRAENLIDKTNELTRASTEIMSTTAQWSILLDDINAHIIEGIVISNFSAPSITEPMSLVGTAKDRNTLNELKKSLQKSLYLSEINLPITHLEQKGDIPFSISFRLKDPRMLYNQ